MLFPSTVPNTAASMLSINFGIFGPNSTITQKEVCGELAILMANDILNSNKAKYMFVGSGDEISAFIHHTYYILNLIKDNPVYFSNKNFKTILGEGFGLILTEKYKKGKKRIRLNQKYIL